MPYRIVVSQPGYLPETDPYVVDDLTAAREAVAAELETSALAVGVFDADDDALNAAAVLPVEGGSVESHGYTIEAIPVSEQAARLEELRAVIRAECISYGEIAELQALAPYIEPGDVELLEWAGVPEHAQRAQLTCPECDSLTIDPPYAHHLARCCSCGVAFDTMADDGDPSPGTLCKGDGFHAPRETCYACRPDLYDIETA
jgi:hypothetical protein